MKKALWPQWNLSPRFIVPMERVWFHEQFFFEVVMVILKISENTIKSIYALREVDKRNVTSSFQGI